MFELSFTGFAFPCMKDYVVVYYISKWCFYITLKQIHKTGCTRLFRRHFFQEAFFLRTEQEGLTDGLVSHINHAANYISPLPDLAI